MRRGRKAIDTHGGRRGGTRKRSVESAGSVSFFVPTSICPFVPPPRVAQFVEHRGQGWLNAVRLHVVDGCHRPAGRGQAATIAGPENDQVADGHQRPGERLAPADALQLRPLAERVRPPDRVHQCQQQRPGQEEEPGQAEQDGREVPRAGDECRRRPRRSGGYKYSRYTATGIRQTRQPEPRRMSVLVQAASPWGVL